jgi:hypothetical protein
MQVNDMIIKVLLVGNISLLQEETLISHFQMLEGALSDVLQLRFISLLLTASVATTIKIRGKNDRNAKSESRLWSLHR